LLFGWCCCEKVKSEKVKSEKQEVMA
jgi:hypothetical protein